MSGLNEKPIVVNLNMDKETTDYIAKHDYIKVGDKEFISRDRAKMLVEKLANGATTGAEQCNLPVVNGWLDFQSNKELFNEEAKKNCLCKFEDGTVIRYDEDHPMEVMTHFKLACR